MRDVVENRVTDGRLLRPRGPAAVGLLRALVFAATIGGAGCQAPEPHPAESLAPGPPVPSVAPEATHERPARVVDADSLALFAEIVGPTRDQACGPYRLRSDAASDETGRRCAAVGLVHQDAFARRYALELRNTPAETILIFAERADFRRFVAAGRLASAGYAAVADPFRGFLAMTSEDIAAEVFAQTLAHEMTHLVSRRAFAAPLGPWLAEGMANDLGLAFDEEGLTDDGSGRWGHRGLSHLVERLQRGLTTDEVLGLEGLTSRGGDQFDRAVVSYDYETSSALVRFLIEDDTLGGRFRDYLIRLAAGEDVEDLAAELGLGWAELEERLLDWLDAKPAS